MALRLSRSASRSGPALQLVRRAVRSPYAARMYATESKTEQKEQEAKTGQGGGTGGGGDDGEGGGGGGDGDGRGGDGEENKMDKPDDPQFPETWETRQERLAQWWDEVVAQQKTGDPALQPRVVQSQNLPPGQRFPEWSAQERQQQEAMVRFLYGTYGPERGRAAFLWWARRAQNFATFEYAEFLRQFPDTEVHFSDKRDLRVFFRGVELQGTTLDETINRKLDRADELKAEGRGGGGDDFENWRLTLIAPETSVHDLTWRLPFWILVWLAGVFALHYLWQDLFEAFDKIDLRGYFADPRTLEPALRDLADFVAGMDCVQDRLGRGGDISVDLGSFRLYHHGRELEFLFMIGGDLGVAAATVTMERELEAQGNFLGMAMGKRQVLRPRYAFVELPLDYYAEWDFVGTRKYACNKVDQLIEVVDGTLFYDNLKVASWIQENMDYEKVQDAKSRETFEVDLQEAKLRVLKSRDAEVQAKTLPGLRKLEDFTRRLNAVQDHLHGKKPYAPLEEDNFEALQGMYLKQLRREREYSNMPQFQGVTAYEQEEEKIMQAQAIERALQHKRGAYWTDQAKRTEAEYAARLEREEASRRDETPVGGERLVRRTPPATRE